MHGGAGPKVKASNLLTRNGTETVETGVVAGVLPEQRVMVRSRPAADRILPLVLIHLAICTVIYVALTIVCRAFPYVQAGADLVTQMKHQIAKTGRPFQNPGALHIAVFGNSRVLSGFIPAQFDEAVAAVLGRPVESYNFGLPGDTRFVDDLETMITRGVGPDVVLLTASWTTEPESQTTPFHFWANDQEIIDRLFPFRRLPRDLLILAASSHGSPARAREIYENNRKSMQAVEASRGYYFLARMSHFRNDELPPDLQLQTDTPSVMKTRDVPAHAPDLENLAALFAAHHIRCLLVPTYYREHEYAAAPPINQSTERALAGRANFAVLGPDYYLFPNNYFSDPKHLNPRGAQVYTDLLVKLTARTITGR